jgi:enoyl-CoA hydratase/carnithine racemase
MRSIRFRKIRANKIVILTGAGGEFITDVEWSSFGNVADPGVWSQVHDEGVQALENIANIRVPVIAAIEGRAHVHSDYALLASVIVAADGATFQDVAHFSAGIAPGDGIFTTWSYRAGAGRAEAFLLNPQPLKAQTAHEWGVVAEVVPNGKALVRARELAKLYLKAPEVNPSQYARTFHSTVEGAHRARSWIRTIARRIVRSRSRQINASRE